jgi:molecular chaperone GrpE
MSEEASGQGEARASQERAAQQPAAHVERPAGGEDAAAEIETLRRQAAESWEKYLRATAELDNLRKRAAREVEIARKYGLESLAQAIVPVRDSLEAGLASAENADVAVLLEGTRATLRLLDQALTSAGVEEIDPHGEPFDPTAHEAITLRQSAHVEPNTVVEVIQKGFRIHDRLLRPARVIVSQAPPDA